MALSTQSGLIPGRGPAQQYKPIRIIQRVTVAGFGVPKVGDEIDVLIEDAYYLVSHGKAEFVKPKASAGKAAS